MLEKFQTTLNLRLDLRERNTRSISAISAASLAPALGYRRCAHHPVEIVAHASDHSMHLMLRYDVRHRSQPYVRVVHARSEVGKRILN